MNIPNNNSVLLLYPGFMRGQFSKLSLAVGILLGLISGLLTFLITYTEYSRQSTTKKESLKMATKAALAAWCFFFSVALIIGFFVMLYRL